MTTSPVAAPPGTEVATGPAVLADGARIEVVPMDGTDGPRLVRFHGRLSAESTRLRYFTLHLELTGDELERFTHVDHVQREALIAVAEDEIIGVARFDRTSPDGPDAEAAFVVADAWQGRGVGSLLLRCLAKRGREVGLRRLVAETLAENHRMLAVFRASGMPMETGFSQGVVSVALDLGAQLPADG